MWVLVFAACLGSQGSGSSGTGVAGTLQGEGAPSLAVFAAFKLSGAEHGEGRGEGSRERKHGAGKRNRARMGALWATGQRKQDNWYSWALVGKWTRKCRTELSGERRDQTQAFCESDHTKTVPPVADRMVFVQPNQSSLLPCICAQISLFMTELTAQSCLSLSCFGHSDKLSWEMF